MKYVNYLVVLGFSIVFTIFASAWIFNHVNAWAGFAVFILIIYFIARKFISITKEEFNEKN
jgi:ABC-type Fe3+-siderophore transport system permease subunit